jgi:hypothetical protein
MDALRVQMVENQSSRRQGARVARSDARGFPDADLTTARALGENVLAPPSLRKARCRIVDAALQAYDARDEERDRL